MQKNPSDGTQYHSGAGVNTRTTTVGLLPDSVAIGLLVLVSLGTVGLGRTFGYAAWSLSILCLAGAIGAYGVRLASTERSRQIVLGLTLLWIAGLGFAAMMVLLNGQSRESIGAGGLFFAIGVATGSLLGPFGIVGSTVRFYGHGAGSRVLRRFLFGTIVLLGLVSGLLLVMGIRTYGGDFLGFFIPSSLAGSRESEVIFLRSFLAIWVYGLFLYVGMKVAQVSPVEVLVPPREATEIEELRGDLRNVYTRGKQLLIWFALFYFVSLIIAAADVEPVAQLTQLLLYVVSLPVIIAVVVLCTVLGLAILGGVRVLRSANELSEGAIAEVVLPPIVAFLVAVVISVLFGDTIMARYIEPELAARLSADSSLYELFTVHPLVPIVVCIGLALLCCAAVMSVPSLIASKSPGDASLSGIAGTVIAIALLVVLVVAGDGPLYAIVMGVVLAAVVWEFGEFSTVAAGELGPQSGEYGFPAGFGKLASIHAIVTVIIAVVGVALTAGAVTVASGAAIPVTAAVFIIILSGIGIAALTILLTG